MRKKLGLGCLTFLLLTLLAAGVFAYRQHLAFGRSLDQAQALGLPASFDAYGAMDPIPPEDENAAVAYAIAAAEASKRDAAGGRKAYRSLRHVGDPDAPALDPSSPEHFALAQSFLADYRPVLDALHRAAAMERCRFGRIGEMTDAAPSRGRAYELAPMLALEADTALRAGRPEEAVRAIETLFAMTRHHANHPVSTAHYGTNEIRRIALETAEAVLDRGGLSDENLTGLATVLDGAYGIDAFLGGWSGVPVELLHERRRTIQSLRNGGGGGPRFFAWVLLRRAWAAGATPFIDGVYAYRIDWYLRYFEAAQAPMPETLAAFGRIDQEADASSRWFPIGYSHNLGLKRAYIAYAESSARARLLAARCAIERYRLANGARPDSLDALVPAFAAEVPIDPFDGRPLRYGARTDGGHTLYAIGPNQSDDGGSGDDLAIPLDPENGP